MGETDLQAIAARHGLPLEAVETLVLALRRGGGRQAQFSHPALGGMGQWSRGGAIMIGDMFNHSLKAQVAKACDEIAGQLGEDAGLHAEHAPGDWWPSGLGRPASVGSQNDQGYAFFPETRRLAVRNGGVVRLYDTREHRITGVSQQQSNGSGIASFTSQNGDVRLADLSPVHGRPSPSEGSRGGGDGHTPEPQAAESSPPHPDDRGGSQDVLATIERLHELHRKGVLTDAEFADKKKDLLARL